MAQPTGLKFMVGNGGAQQTLTASGAVDPGASVVGLSHTSTAVAATIADAKDHSGLFALVDNSASGTASHTLTLTSGTFDGTNNKATMNAAAESILVWIDEDGEGIMIVNTGSVSMSAV